MLAILIIGLLILALVVVMGSRGGVELERDELRIELEGRKCADEADKPFNPDKPCGHPQCEYPLCSLHPAGSPPARHPQNLGCYLNDGLNYYADDEVLTTRAWLYEMEELKKIADSRKSSRNQPAKTPSVPKEPPKVLTEEEWTEIHKEADGLFKDLEKTKE